MGNETGRDDERPSGGEGDRPAGRPPEGTDPWSRDESQPPEASKDPYVDPHEPNEDIPPWEREGAFEDDEEDDDPLWVRAVGTTGMYISYVCALLAFGGLAGLYFEVQPYANVAIVLALVGLGVSMGMALVAQTAGSGNVLAFR